MVFIPTNNLSLEWYDQLAIQFGLRGNYLPEVLKMPEAEASNDMKKYITLIGVVFISLFMYFVWYSTNISELKPEISTVEVHSDSLKESLFLIKETRGLNYAVSVISSSSEKQQKPDIEKEYVYSAGDPTLFYKLEKDTLSVYTYHLAKEPSSFDSNIKVQQVELSNNEYSSLIDQYQTKGLKKF